MQFIIYVIKTCKQDLMMMIVNFMLHIQKERETKKRD